MGVYLVHHPLHTFSPEVGGGRLHGNGRLQGTLQYYHQCLNHGTLTSNTGTNDKHHYHQRKLGTKYLHQRLTVNVVL